MEHPKKEEKQLVFVAMIYDQFRFLVLYLSIYMIINNVIGYPPWKRVQLSVEYKSK